MGTKQHASKGKRTWALALVGFLAALVIAACSPADAGPNGPDPTQYKPEPVEVLNLDDELAFVYYPGVDLFDLEWDLELEYVTREIADVYEHYKDTFDGLGFELDSEDIESSEIDAEFSNADGVELSIELERDDGRVEVDIDIDADGTYTAEEAADPSPTSFLGMTIPVFPGVTVRDVEWDYNFDHPGGNGQQVFEHYDEQLQNRGWDITKIDNDDDDEWEADYRQPNRVHLELEVEDEDGVTEVEFELNKARFYPTAE